MIEAKDTEIGVLRSGLDAEQELRRRQESERDRRKDRKPGGQPGHPGMGLSRDPDPDETKPAEPPAECRRCKASPSGCCRGWSARAAEQSRSRARRPGAHAGSVSYGPVLNAAAVVLTAYGNVPPERAAQVMGMLLDVPVSPGWVDKASTRLAAQLGKAGFDAIMLAALAARDALRAYAVPSRGRTVL